VTVHCTQIAVVHAAQVVKIRLNVNVAVDIGRIEGVSDELEDKYADTVEGSGCLAALSVQGVIEMSKKLDK
jgi:hypothetical protein